MYKRPELRILFATSFSDACFKAARAVAQLADSCRLSLTIVHAVNEHGKRDTAGTRRELESFFAEADHYDYCRRVLLRSPNPAEVIAEVCRREACDLVMAPASDRIGLHRLLRPSRRARLLKECAAPLWTAGDALDSFQFRRSIQTVACTVDFDHLSETYLRSVAAFASRMGAKLRLLHVVPRVHEGTLASSLWSESPLMPEFAAERLASLFDGESCPEIDVAVGSQVEELPRLLRRSEADVVFLGPGQALRDGWQPRLATAVDKLPCPVICMDGASANFSQWSFETVDQLHGRDALALAG